MHSELNLNIHIILPDPIANFAISLNSKINNIASGEIHFTSPAEHIPHLTLTMGQLSRGTSLEAVFDRTGRLADEIRPFQLASAHVYLAKPSRKFVFLMCPLQKLSFS